MATLCKNCGGALIFDPATQKMVCEYCGGRFLPEEIEAEDKELLKDKQAQSMNDIYGTDEEEFLDCYIYTCNNCGGEIIINGTEASTNCIYCGNSAVVFSRIAKQKKPQFIIPFQVTKEQAVSIIRGRFNKGIFVPKEIKNFNPSNVRGIYIPYWIVDAETSGSVVVEGQVKSGKNSVTRYFGRGGRMKIRRLPLDASVLLSDESSSRLEPYNTSTMKDFDEDYLRGFYSNISDVTYADLRRAVNKRAQSFFDESAIDDVKGASSKKVISSRYDTAIDYDTLNYAMFPAWFVTYDYKGKHNTILVNGESGKVVCGVPWNKVLFYSLLIASGILLTVLFFFLFKNTLPFILSTRSSRSSSNNNGKILGFIVAGVIALFSVGITRIRKVIKSINLTQEQAIFNFVKKRQE
ncbi:MAG: TFIIB-type zinc ribbon-containing protein [Clostridiales bacterium]|nr:TFIIB-type zinc ribbon-containing protein [Clostridiales bacterium]